MLLQDKAAIITGAAQGIGFCIAEAMAAQGACVLIMDVKQERLAEACRSINARFGEKAFPFQGDITNTGDIEAFFNAAMARFGRIDILVNNAGVAKDTPIEDITPEEWNFVLNVNLNGSFFLTQRVYRQMMRQRFGRIISIASLAGERGGRAAGAHYSVLKAGLIVLTKCLALTGGEYNITANAIAPGLIDTEMARALGHKPDEVPLKRLGDPEDVASAAVFLASDMAKYVSGMTLDVNGGQFMR